MPQSNWIKKRLKSPLVGAKVKGETKLDTKYSLKERREMETQKQLGTISPFPDTWLNSANEEAHDITQPIQPTWREAAALDTALASRRNLSTPAELKIAGDVLFHARRKKK